MLSGAAPHQVAEAGDDELDILYWRYEQFVQLGYSDLQAHTLAASDADLGLARTLRRSGCGADLALRNLL
jgi:hypothetical protein